MLVKIVTMLTDVNILSTTVRILLAMLIGGGLGMERERKRRPAGLRTYILVCVGACLVMITNMYMSEVYGGDPGRLPAQVITGMGFLGAGTIMVTRNNQVKGLTTAAGLWGTACIGLAVGAGFYYGALLSFAVFFISMRVFSRLDQRIGKASTKIFVYMEMSNISHFRTALAAIRADGIHVDGYSLDKSWSGADAGASATIDLKICDGRNHTEVIDFINTIDGIVYAEEV